LRIISISRRKCLGALSESMRVIALKAFWTNHPDAETALRGWYKTVRKVAWVDFASVRETFGSADLAGKCVVFNIGGNKYRLIAAVHYQKRDRNGMVVEGRVYIRDVLTHRDYDKGTWKSACDCS
jgi:mRNA interferase HigB